MKRLFLLFSHKLTKEQIEDAEENFNISKFVYLPEELQSMWSNIGEDDIGLDRRFKKYIKEKAETGDYILIEGEYGMVYKMVKWALENNYIPVYSYTKREYSNKVLEDGTVENKHYFKHIKFKEYK